MNQHDLKFLFLIVK